MLEILELQTGKTLKPLVRKIDLASSPAPADCLSALKKPRRHKFGSRETEIVERICRDNQFVERCLSALYDLQERQEKAAGKTIYKNGVGFNAADAQVLGSMAQQILAGEPLTPAQLAICRQPTRSGISRLGQYRGQLRGIINDLPPNSDSGLSLKPDGDTATDDNALTVDAIGSERIQ